MSFIKMKSSSKSERRKFRRIETTIFCQLVQGRERIESVSRDISGGGLMFEIDRFTPPLATFELEIYQPVDYRKSKIVSIFIFARVVWIKEIEESPKFEGSNKYVVGIEFIEIEEEDRTMIAKYVAEKAQGVNRYS